MLGIAVEMGIIASLPPSLSHPRASCSGPSSALAEVAEKVLGRNAAHVGCLFKVVLRRRPITILLSALALDDETGDDEKEYQSGCDC